MATSHSFILILPFIFIFLISSSHSDSIPPLDTPQLSPLEQESVYQVLESINSTYNWRYNYPDDLCYSSPHGIICDYFDNSTVHVTELSLGYISDTSPNPICSSTAAFSPSLASLPYLRKLFFYRCFTNTSVSLPAFFRNLSPTLEELVFIENPTLSGTINDKIQNLENLKRLVVTGSNVSGEISEVLGLVHLQQLTLTRNLFNGEVPYLGRLKELKVLDLSNNVFTGNAPESVGELSELFILNLGSNGLSGRIPDSLVKLHRLELLDLSYNRFGNFGIPLFLGEMTSLKEVYLSGNSLGGPIPEIWGKLGGIVGMGLSELGLVGKIPPSMGLYLRNVNYLRLDNNHLEGTVPVEFGLLETVLNELNLENNFLSGRLPFSDKFHAKIGGKLKLAGNSDLCVNEGIDDDSAKGYMKLCKKLANPNPVVFSGSTSSSSKGYSSFVFLLGVGFFFVLLGF